MLQALSLVLQARTLVITFNLAVKQEAARVGVALPLHASGWQLLGQLCGLEGAQSVADPAMWEDIRTAAAPALRGAAAAILQAQSQEEPAAQAQLDLAAARAPLVPLLCANPTCTNLKGASELRLRGRRCSGGCGTRYCCQACAAANWPQHRRACAQLAIGRG